MDLFWEIKVQSKESANGVICINYKWAQTTYNNMCMTIIMTFSLGYLQQTGPKVSHNKEETVEN